MKRLFILILLLSLTTLLYAGCGKSPDELYKSAQTLISDRNTIDEGLSALLDFERMYPEDARVPEVLLSIATVYQAKQEYENAINAFQRLIEHYPDTPEEYKGRFLLGYLYYDELSDTDRATDIFTEFIAAYPDSELTASAIILMENINLPIEEWAVFEDIESSVTSTDGSNDD